MPDEQKANVIKEIIEWILYFVSVLVASFIQSQLFA